MHVQMNVADKETFFAEIADRLRPGAPLATFEICRAGQRIRACRCPGRSTAVTASWPRPTTCSATIRDSGFEPIEWVDETAWVLDWFQQRGARAAAAGTAATLPALLADGPTRMMNLAAAFGAAS